jgi:hypothetical protein
MGGLEIGSLVLAIGILIFLFPAAKHWLNNSPKSEKGDWEAFLFPVALVIVFVGGLMWLVSR